MKLKLDGREYQNVFVVKDRSMMFGTNYVEGYYIHSNGKPLTTEESRTADLIICVGNKISVIKNRYGNKGIIDEDSLPVEDYAKLKLLL